ncbi:MAG TPA: aminotransferase class III-fold pyridoxal phosphate-dependent enzyme, partial [Anaerolineales bacterium]|nr:aminotransferase class III-fold pyridoxal phosphate-dependent enzyme [Anaerolineales bacterium]
MDDTPGNPFAGQALRRPQLTAERARAVLRDRYGLEPSRLKPLDSFRDQNSRVDLADGRQFVLKIANHMEPRGSLELENGALATLARTAPDLPVPRLLPDRDGAVLIQIDIDGATHYARLLTYAPGRILADRPLYAPPLIEAFAQSAARLVRGLSAYAPPNADRRLQWDLQVARDVVGAFSGYVREPEHQDLVREMVARYERDAVPVLDKLRRSVIHGDLVGWNVIVAALPGAVREPATGAQLTVTGSGAVADPDQIVGLIDFGDTALSYSVGELAVVLADVAMHTERPLVDLCRAVRAFCEEYPLEEPEADALFALVGMRVAVTATSAAQQAALDPDNPYVAELNTVDWPTLRKLAAIDPGLGRAALRQAAGFAPLAHSHSRVAWVEDNLADVVVVAVPEGPIQPLDLSIGSDLFVDGNWETDSAVQAALASELDHFRAERVIGVGRWGEPRLFHALWPGVDEPHTTHLGCDVFVAAGAPVRAPLAGVVRTAEAGVLVIEHATPHGPIYTRWSGIEPLWARSDAVAAGDLLGHVIAADEDVALPPHLHLQIGLLLIGDDLPALARSDEAELWLALCPNPARLMGLRPGVCAYRPPAPDLVERRARVLPRSQETYYARPPVIVRGWRQYLVDRHGRAYLDAINNVAHIGHSHPAVTRACDRQTRRLNTNSRFLYDNLIEYAERLTALLPDPLRVVYFCNSGSEANDLAFRLARAHTGRPDILTVAGAYHGNTTLAAEAGTSLLDNPDGQSPPAHIHPIPQPNLYRGPYRADDPQAAARYAADAGAVMDAAAAAGRPAGALIAEAL